jgi:negative regulator of sigma E activity
MAASRSGTEWRAVEISSASSWQLSDRYALSGPESLIRLGRPAVSYTVVEDGRPRVRMVVDEASAVPLMTEVLDGDGRVYRLAVMVDFEAGDGMDRLMADPMDELSGMPQMETMVAVDPPASLPDEVAGYRRVDTYLVTGETVQAFYSDGLFSFSVFEARRGATPETFRDAATWEVAGERYRRIVTPAHAWVQWHAPDRSYVLVGDLPPDHLAEVLSALPEPGNRSWFVRMWRRLFG